MDNNNDSRIKDIIYKRKNGHDIVNDPEVIASCKREQSRDIIDNTRLGSYDKYGNYIIIPEIKRELMGMPKLVYNQYSSGGAKIFELKSSLPIFNDIFMKLVITGDIANLLICEQVNREAGGYLESYDEIIDSLAIGTEERMPQSLIFRTYNIYENPTDFGKELKDSKFDNILTRKVYLSLLAKELRNASTSDEKDAFKNMVSILKQGGTYGRKVLDEFLGRLKDRPAIFEISKAENYNKALNEVLISSLEVATTEQDKQDSETRRIYLSVLSARDRNIDEELSLANERVSEEYVKHIVDKAKEDFTFGVTDALSASDEFYSKLNENKQARRRTLDKPILKQGKEASSEPKTKEEKIKQILSKNVKKTPKGQKLKASKGKKSVKKLKVAKKKKANAKKKTKAKVKSKKKVKKAKPKKKIKAKRKKPKKGKVKSKKKVKKPKKKVAKKKSAKKKVKRKLAKSKLKKKKGKVKAKKKKVKKPKNAKKAKSKAGKVGVKKAAAPKAQKLLAAPAKKKVEQMSYAMKLNILDSPDPVNESNVEFTYKAGFDKSKNKDKEKEGKKERQRHPENISETYNLSLRITSDISQANPFLAKEETIPKEEEKIGATDKENGKEVLIRLQNSTMQNIGEGQNPPITATMSERTSSVPTMNGSTQTAAQGSMGAQQGEVPIDGSKPPRQDQQTREEFNNILNNIIGNQSEVQVTQGEQSLFDVDSQNSGEEQVESEPEFEPMQEESQVDILTEQEEQLENQQEQVGLPQDQAIPQEQLSKQDVQTPEDIIQDYFK